jgi:hypothetical protein
VRYRIHVTDNRDIHGIDHLRQTVANLRETHQTQIGKTSAARDRTATGIGRFKAGFLYKARREAVVTTWGDNDSRGLQTLSKFGGGAHSMLLAAWLNKGCAVYATAPETAYFRTRYTWALLISARSSS